MSVIFDAKGSEILLSGLFRFSPRVKMAQEPIGTGLHISKCPLSRASSWGIYYLSYGTWWSHSVLSKNVNDEKRQQAVACDWEYFCSWSISNWKFQISLKTDQNISQPSKK